MSSRLQVKPFFPSMVELGVDTSVLFWGCYLNLDSRVKGWLRVTSSNFYNHTHLDLRVSGYSM